MISFWWLLPVAFVAYLLGFLTCAIFTLSAEEEQEIRRILGREDELNY